MGDRDAGYGVWWLAQLARYAVECEVCVLGLLVGAPCVNSVVCEAMVSKICHL